MEEPIHFTCNNKRLYGVLHIPDSKPEPSTVVIIVTGGPQIRSGAHRLYVQLSRHLCRQNWASLRFDYEGLGDSEGDFVGFRHAGASISSAVHFLQNKFKGQVNIVFWALCDGATAAVLYAAIQPEHIKGLILCNPLTYTTQGMARSTIKHYYGRRFFKKDFLHKLIRFKLDLHSTINELRDTFLNAQFLKRTNSTHEGSSELPLPKMVLESLHKFKNPIRIILSTDDIVASNFRDEWKKMKADKKKLNGNNIMSHVIDGADHTFVDPLVKEKLFHLTLRSLDEIISSGTENSLYSQ